MKKFTVTAIEAGTRADIFVAAHLPRFSRASLKGLFDDHVSLNSKKMLPSHKLRTGDVVSVDTSLLDVVPEPVQLPVIYEDDDVVVINKPAGILTHSKGALNPEATVASFLQTKITDKNLTGNRAGIVHRLDRGTSGVMIGAKNSEALKWLQQQFSTRKVEKTYLAIVEDQLEPPLALIDAPIGRNPNKPQTFKVMSSGKSAQTEYEVQKSLEISGRKYSLVQLTPRTGRTHQIRVHLAYIDHPVVGDSLYANYGNQPLLLHASQLSVSLPNRQKPTFKVPMPDSFKKFMR